MTAEFSREERNELVEVFLAAYQAEGLEVAVDAVATASRMYVSNVRLDARDADCQEALGMVARAMGCRPGALTIRSKQKDIVERRWIAMWLLRMRGMPWPRLSLPKIARTLDMRDHAATLHGVRQVYMDQGLLLRALGVVEKAIGEKGAV